MSNFFLGIDASLNSAGVVLYNSTSMQYQLIKPYRKLKEGPRLAFIYEQFKAFIDAKEIPLCVMEGPAYHATTKAFSMGEAYGLFKLVCAQHNIPLLLASPTQLKKYFTGSAGASKYKMIVQSRCLGYSGDSDDIADALACASLSMDIFNKTNTMEKRSSLEVIHALTKKYI